MNHYLYRCTYRCLTTTQCFYHPHLEIVRARCRAWVTPHLVRPARPGDVIKTPADTTLPPNDVDFFLLGKTEVTRAEARKLTPAVARVAIAGDRPFTGHMLDIPNAQEVSDVAGQ